MCGEEKGRKERKRISKNSKKGRRRTKDWGCAVYDGPGDVE
jgi:hypothetical protein